MVRHGGAAGRLFENVHLSTAPRRRACRRPRPVLRLHTNPVIVYGLFARSFSLSKNESPADLVAEIIIGELEIFAKNDTACTRPSDAPRTM